MQDQFSQFTSKKNLASLLVLAILVLAIPLGVNLVRQQQILKSRATGEQITFASPGIDQRTGPKGDVTVAVAQTIGLNLSLPDGWSFTGGSPSPSETPEVTSSPGPSITPGPSGDARCDVAKGKIAGCSCTQNTQCKNNVCQGWPGQAKICYGTGGLCGTTTGRPDYCDCGKASQCAANVCTQGTCGKPK